LGAPDTRPNGATKWKEAVVRRPISRQSSTNRAQTSRSIAEEAPLEEIVELMEKNNVKRLPVTRGDKVVGIVSRANLLQAVASLARHVPDPTADDDHIRNRIINALEKNDWCPFGLNVIVRDGVVHLSGVITEERSRQAAIVAAENVTGVKKVHDHLCWVDTMSGMYLNSPEDESLAKAS
jgi:CBS-domain-containing membrane protein